MKIDVEFMIVKKFGVDFDYGVDLIISISRNVNLNDDLWFEIENSIDVKLKDFKILQNVYRALLEVYVSFHENNDSWYGNSVNEYVSLNNLSVSRNDAFREVIVSLDEMVVGVVWLFTMIYIGGDDKLVLDWMPLLSS
ncbi:Peptide-N4-(N-acetyl-beta-glucosaminyl)asparagine amidase A [Capsicum baccatum]|uniref:Peptide-N4-(N-acetyl-beta-glucosaminyl)asparagine amidase A n=1 Tax=Capsicum baccatum TaxID=33114 RepID=A0A2G2X9P5_CAPBA|nr:Peptide-N4-(N-acetyl-beta-glucosaminyl)asparagine amidase A [Capsicum baccatum]